MIGVDRTRLVAVLDRLVPARDGLPGAGGLGLADAVLADAESVPRLAVALARVLDALPDEFASVLDDGARDAALRRVEAADPDAFAGAVNLAYNAYYVHPAVRRGIEGRHGYSAAAPQPAGHPLPDFDPALLRSTAARAQSWRGAP